MVRYWPDKSNSKIGAGRFRLVSRAVGTLGLELIVFNGSLLFSLVTLRSSALEGFFGRTYSHHHMLEVDVAAFYTSSK